ncbi:helix-turn-helix transcriptional regulator [uncultured Lactobacillus sp.]|uniref:helix-turn-helix domain-containing protein n=1 Tax=uncultured Lactobacillus sp. TaxID=153152 RepID=UPI0026226B01|nr:helix-turn-helix transcriptional regulator [uncultured Lactobacillus sp.]
MTEFSDKLKYERERRGWSKTKLAKYVGVGLSTYANWEYGIAEPDIATIKKICQALDISSDILLDLSISSSNATEKDDLDDMIDDARFFDGKQMDEHDKELVRSILKRIYNEK